MACKWVRGERWSIHSNSNSNSREEGLEAFRPLRPGNTQTDYWYVSSIMCFDASFDTFDNQWVSQSRVDSLVQFYLTPHPSHVAIIFIFIFIELPCHAKCLLFHNSVCIYICIYLLSPHHMAYVFLAFTFSTLISMSTIITSWRVSIYACAQFPHGFLGQINQIMTS